MSDIRVRKGDGAMVPFSVPLFDGTTPRENEADNLRLQFHCMDNGTVFDQDDGTFKVTPVSPDFALSPLASAAHMYYMRYAVGSFKRGHYIAHIRHLTTEEEWTIPFIVGVNGEESLGYTATYITDPSAKLDVSVWVEEGGHIQTDVTKLSGVTLRNASGEAIWTASSDYTVQTEGIFRIPISSTLNAATSYVFECVAHFPGQISDDDFSTKLRFGMVRP